MLESLFNAFGKMFEFFGLKQKEKINVISDEDHKKILKRKEEEKLKAKINSTILKVKSTTGHEQEKHLKELQRLLSE